MNFKMVYQCRAEQRAPRLDLVEPGTALAIDCEGVLLPNETRSNKNGCGRVSIVNEREEVVYDTFAHYGPYIEHRPPPQRFKLGVKYKDILPKFGAQHIDQVTQDVASLLDRAGLVVGHDIKCEMQLLRDVPWDKYETRDTQQMDWEEADGKGLRDVASAVLGRSIQGTEHSSVEDAQATMALYLLSRNRYAPIDLHDSGISSDSGSVSGAEDFSGLDFGTPATTICEVDETTSQNLQAHRARIPGWVAQAHLVALPNVKEIARGRKFDALTSTYYRVRLGGPNDGNRQAA